MEKLRKNPPSKANIDAEKKRANKTNQKIMKLGRDIERLQSLMRKQKGDVQTVIQQVKQSANQKRSFLGGAAQDSSANDEGAGGFGLW